MKPNRAIFCAAVFFPCTVWAVTSNCTSEEAIIFSCNTGKNVVSVCASQNLSAQIGYLQYRFGPINKPNLAIPEKKVHPGSEIQAKTLTFAGGGGAYVRFQRGSYGYVVYNSIIKGEGEKAGVAVVKDGKTTTNLRCKGAASSELGPDFFAKAGLMTDANDFDIP